MPEWQYQRFHDRGFRLPRLQGQLETQLGEVARLEEVFAIGDGGGEEEEEAAAE